MMPDNLDPNLNQEQNQQLIKSGWEKLKQDGVYEINFFGAEVNISSRVGIAIPTRIFFRRAEIFKSGFFVQKYSNQGILCRNIGQVPLRVTQSCSADYLDQIKAKQAAPDCTAAVRIYIQVTL